eukprot:3510951-Amphidinium_carterae.1
MEYEWYVANRNEEEGCTQCKAAARPIVFSSTLAHTSIHLELPQISPCLLYTSPSPRDRG